MFKQIKLLLLFLLLNGCSSERPKTSLPTLRMNISQEPCTLDPRAGEDLASSTMQFLLFEGLMRLQADGTVCPAQAARVDISEDKLTYTFYLRASHWSDGSIVTALDFENAWKKILSPQFASPNAHLLYPIKNGEKVKKGELSVEQLGVYTTDDLTLIVELEKPTPYFLNLICFCVFSPVPSEVDRSNPHWMQDASSDFICNGPFKLKRWTHNQELLLEKNREYWDASAIELEQIAVSLIGDEMTALSLFEKGQLDIIGRGSSPIPVDALAKYSSQGALKVHPYPGTTAVCFNTKQFPFNNVHIRKAFSLAIDRSQIVRNITSLGEEVATCINFFNRRRLFEDHNTVEAQKHLALGLKQLGISVETFPKIKLNFSFSDINRRIAQVLQEEWLKTLGIQVEIAMCEHKVLLDRLTSRDYDLSLVIWVAQYNDPMSILERFKFKINNKNYPGWEHPDYIRLLDQSAYDQTPEERQNSLNHAEDLLFKEMPLSPIYHWQSVFMIQDHLMYEEVAPMGAFDYTRIKLKR